MASRHPKNMKIAGTLSWATSSLREPCKVRQRQLRISTPLHHFGDKNKDVADAVTLRSR